MLGHDERRNRVVHAPPWSASTISLMTSSETAS